MKTYIMALDQGTTSSRCILIDQSGAVAALSQREYPQHYPKPGWVEHDAMEIYDTQLAVAREAMAELGVTARDIAAIGIANQRETTILWDRETGEPVGPAIVWQCRRTAPFCDELIRSGHQPMIQEKTGLLVDAYFSASKIRWMLENIPGVRERAERGEVLFGTVDTWLCWKLSGGAVHCTDPSNASRTMLYNIHTLSWDEELCRLFGVPMAMLPEVKTSSEIYAPTAPGVFDRPIPIAGALGDQQAALFGQTCFAPGMAKNTYGTGCFMLLNTGEQMIRSKNGLLTTVAWKIGDTVTYALEGSVFVAGAALKWLRDELGLIGHAAQSEVLANTIPDTGGVYMVPAFVGLGAPYWDQDARGVIVGLTQGSGKAHIVRAALESLAYQVSDVLGAMAIDAGQPIQTLQVDGGASVNNFLMQFQADLIDKPVERPVCTETTALGAAYMAGLAVGFWEDAAHILRIRRVDRVFQSEMEEHTRRKLLSGWEDAVMRARSRA